MDRELERFRKEEQQITNKKILQMNSFIRKILFDEYTTDTKINFIRYLLTKELLKQYKNKEEELLEKILRKELKKLNIHELVNFYDSFYIKKYIEFLGRIEIIEVFEKVILEKEKEEFEKIDKDFFQHQLKKIKEEIDKS